MIEIGVYYGGSLRMWSTLLPETTVVGIDIEDYTALHDDGDHVRVVVGDQAAAEVMDKALALLDGPPELVIDDGSHIPSHQVCGRVCVAVCGVCVCVSVWSCVPYLLTQAASVLHRSPPSSTCCLVWRHMACL